MSDPADLGAFLAHAWQRLGRGVADRRSAARHPGFATVSPDGLPEVRTVVLRAADRAEGMIEVHTDAASAKCRSLAARPRAELHIWEPGPRLQIRLSAEVEVLRGQAVAARWARVPETSRMGYGADPAPGSILPAPFSVTSKSDMARFAVLLCRIDRIDLLELGTRHRRAVFAREKGWRGVWVAP